MQFGAAFELMKRHRINMNLMYDHNPTAFLSNVDTFVRQLDLPANINLFLTDLRFDAGFLQARKTGKVGNLIGWGKSRENNFDTL